MKYRIKQALCRVVAVISLGTSVAMPGFALDNPSAATDASRDPFVVIAPDGEIGKPLSILLDESDYKGVWIAAENLSAA